MAGIPGYPKFPTGEEIRGINPTDWATQLITQLDSLGLKLNHEIAERWFSNAMVQAIHEATKGNASLVYKLKNDIARLRAERRLLKLKVEQLKASR